MNRYDLIILGSIAKEELSGYDIIQIVKAHSLDQWAKIHVSTLYNRLASLEKSECIVGRSNREGNRPERTLYTLTTKGEQILAQQVLEHLNGFNDDPRTLGYAYLYGAPQEEVKEILNKHITYLSQEIDKLEALIAQEAKPTFFSEGPFLNCMSRDHLQVELKYAKAAIEIINDPEKAKELDHYFSINYGFKQS